MELSQLAGNETLKEQLSQCTREHGLSHAYILSGPRGSGKHTLARLLAEICFCHAPWERRPCLSCAACKKVMGDYHPDLVSVRGEKEKAISVEQIRNLRADAYIRPNEAPRKIYILEQAQRMKGEAQNALLKLLEEGPEYAMFLLLEDEGGGLLPTIHSRCELFFLTPVGEEEALRYLRRRFPQEEEKRLREAAQACQGILGRGVEQLLLPPEEFARETEQARALAKAMEEGEELELFLRARVLDGLKGEALKRLLDRCTEELGSRLSQSRDPERICRGLELLRELRAAAELNVSGGQQWGWLCAGMYT